MLKDAKISTTLPVVDLERAMDFYVGKLGLKAITEDQGMATLEGAHGAQVVLYERGPTKADHTVINFAVDDLEETVKALKEKGVVFEEYDTDMIKTKDGIAEYEGMKSAWFKDTEGNVIGLSEGV